MMAMNVIKKMIIIRLMIFNNDDIKNGNDYDGIDDGNRILIVMVMTMKMIIISMIIVKI